MVPKAPQTSTENLQKKESTFWKSYKVSGSPAVESRLTGSVPHLSQILRPHHPSLLLPFVPSSLPRHLWHAAANLFAENESGRQDHLAVQGDCA